MGLILNGLMMVLKIKHLISTNVSSNFDSSAVYQSQRLLSSNSVMQLFLVSLLFALCLVSTLAVVRLPTGALVRRFDTSRDERTVLTAAILPGSPLVTGTLTQGVINGLSLYSNILLAR